MVGSIRQPYRPRPPRPSRYRRASEQPAAAGREAGFASGHRWRAGTPALPGGGVRSTGRKLDRSAAPKPAKLVYTTDKRTSLPMVVVTLLGYRPPVEREPNSRLLNAH